MRMRVSRYVAANYLTNLAGSGGIILAIFLVTDFVDRVKAYSGENWIRDVFVVYGFKSGVALQQLGPALLLIASGMAVSSMRQRGETVALGALSFGPSSIFVPIAVCAAVCCIGLVVFDEIWVTHASRRVDEIMAQRFDRRGGDWKTYFAPKQWYRKNDRIFYVRAGSTGQGFADVSIFEMTPDFRLRRRIDAQRMEFNRETSWHLLGAQIRDFRSDGTAPVSKVAEIDLELGAEPGLFRILQGRPEQMRIRALSEQIQARQAAGLPDRPFSLALHNRFAYPLAGIPASLLTAGLALRRSRRGYLTTALAEGLVVTLIFWGLMIVCRTLAVAQRMSPQIAAWLPVLLLTVAASALWLHYEGRLTPMSRR